MDWLKAESLWWNQEENDYSISRSISRLWQIFYLIYRYFRRECQSSPISKGDDGREKLIACASRAFNEHEKKYPITEQEYLAIVWEVEKFKQYLGVKSFTIITDHMALEMVKTANLPTGWRAKWLCKLQQYNFTIQHRYKRRILHADAFSRLLNKSNQALANIPIKVLRRKIEQRNCPSPKAKYIMVIVYDKKGVRLSYWLKGEMADL